MYARRYQVQKEIELNFSQFLENVKKCKSFKELSIIYNLPIHGSVNNFFRRFQADRSHFCKSGKKSILEQKNCPKCGEKFVVSGHQDREYCSAYCAVHHSMSKPEVREKIRDAQIKLVLEGKHKGFPPRTEPSYPEKFFIEVLNNNKINFIREKRVAAYSIDFAIEEKKIALEIDAGQHLKDKQKASDDRKDKFLQNLGWKVYRIPWREIKSYRGKDHIRNEINKFLVFYNSTNCVLC